MSGRCRASRIRIRTRIRIRIGPPPADVLPPELTPRTLVHVRSLLACLAAALAACGETEPARDAAMPDARIPIEVAAPLPPLAPAMPALDCPAGWSERTLEEGALVCEPWASDAAPRCADDEIALVGSGCVAIDVCPEDGWPTDLPDAGVIFVSAAAVDGDGSRERPFASLGHAIASATPGDTIALAEGEYEGGVVLRGISLRGACASRTIVRGADALVSAITIEGEQPVELRGVQIIGAAIALRIREGARAVVSSAIVSGSSTAARVEGRLDGERMRIVGRSAPSSVLSFALALRPGSRLALRASVVIGGATGAIGVKQTAEVPWDSDVEASLEDVALLDTPLGAGGAISILRAERVAIERAGTGILITRGNRAELTDVIGRDIALDPGEWSNGLVVSAGTVALRRVYGTRIGAQALMAFEHETVQGEIEGEDVVFDDLRGSEIVTSANGARIELARVAIHRAAGTAFAVVYGGRIVLRDVTVTELAPVSIDYGDAFAALDGELSIERALVRSPGRHTLLMNGEARVGITDLESDGGGVIAICANDGSSLCDQSSPTLSIERARIERAVRYGVGAGNVFARIIDVDIRGVRLDPRDGISVGVIAGRGRIEGARVRVEDVSLIGVASFHDGGAVVLEDLRVERTRSYGCEGCAQTYWGDGVACGFGGALALARFEVSGSDRAGLLVGEGCAAPTFDRGLLHDNAIGILTEPQISDPSLFAGVDVRGNIVDFQTREAHLVPFEVDEPGGP
jgi:hypothetical protein